MYRTLVGGEGFSSSFVSYDAAATGTRTAAAAHVGGCVIGDTRCTHVVALGRAVQVDPIKPMLKAPGTKRIKL